MKKNFTNKEVVEGTPEVTVNIKPRLLKDFKEELGLGDVPIWERRKSHRIIYLPEGYYDTYDLSLYLMVLLGFSQKKYDEKSKEFWDKSKKSFDKK